ncbi:TPA: hypothetical protein DEP58_02530 [Patescibacteria group bacterium]|nr:MAG: Transposase [Parcubacteria group bacterium GW2011_GWD2_42_14]HCC05160.1 hypothetical protein [Patescibacteria group bacterium]
MRNPSFENDEIYHVYNRGVEKRNVFQDAGDHNRFIHHLYEFNDEQKVLNLSYRLSNSSESIPSGKRVQLVRILAFTLMPNHFHLLLQQNEEGGISKFMQKLGTGYTMFFNDKNTRSGALFQGKFKAVHVASDTQLRYVLQYIHLNPLSLCEESSDQNQRIQFLKEYKWSSLPDYVGLRGFPSVTSRTSMLDLFGGMSAYEKSLVQAMNYKTFPDGVDPATLLDLKQPH